MKHLNPRPYKINRSNFCFNEFKSRLLNSWNFIFALSIPRIQSVGCLREGKAFHYQMNHTISSTYIEQRNKNKNNRDTNGNTLKVKFEIYVN